MRQALERALQRFSGLGAQIERVDLGFNPGDFPVFMKGLFSTVMGAMLTEARRSPGQLTPVLRAVIDITGTLGPDSLAAADDAVSR